MGIKWKPIVLAVPDKTIDRLRVGLPLNGLQLSPVTSTDIGTDELYRLLGPLGDFSKYDDNSPFQLWFAKPDGCSKNVVLWLPRQQQSIRYRRLLHENETLILISRAYSTSDRDNADLESAQATVNLLLTLEARDVSQQDTMLSRIKECVSWGLSFLGRKRG